MKLRAFFATIFGSHVTLYCNRKSEVTVGNWGWTFVELCKAISLSGLTIYVDLIFASICQEKYRFIMCLMTQIVGLNESLQLQ